MTKSALRRKINRNNADRHYENRRLPKRTQLRSATVGRSSCESLLPDAEGFILHLSKREKDLLRKSDSEQTQLRSMELSVDSEESNPEPIEQESLSDNEFETHSTVSKSWVRKQLKGPHQGGISKPGCKKHHTTLLRRALLRTRLQLQNTTELSESSRQPSIDPSTRPPNTHSPSSALLDPFMLIQRWASGSAESTMDAKTSASRKRKKKAKSNPNLGTSVGNESRPLTSFKSRSTATHHAIESFRNMLVKF
ncbi:hypothetical protein CSKR_106348 [Clonorchis sinensis]|uniref:Uncharacterized protein n=1 Tax=Clonorchis sinensis TaxID=79923 RepID=A0A8T1LZ84_CLOSI|nr:hypothetical protein CSKR_106348 [Clonorchis sinensis]